MNKMNTPTNIEEFKALVIRYETITLKEIEGAFQELYKMYTMITNPASILTGYGSIYNCTLCKAAYRHDCDYCVYFVNDFESVFCCKSYNKETYDAIGTAETPQELFDAYRARAIHLRKTYPQFLND